MSTATEDEKPSFLLVEFNDPRVRVGKATSDAGEFLESIMGLR